jgi:hypothetical protein
LSIYKIASVRKTCEICNGRGRTGESEKLHTHSCNTHSCNTRSFHPQILPGVGIPAKTAESVLGYLLFKSLDGVAAWPKIAIALAASLTLPTVLRRFSTTSRSLRWSTLAFFLMIVCGGVALEIVRG